MAGRLGGGQPAYIPSPDWSRNLIDYEDAISHAVSIFSDGTGATIAIPGVQFNIAAASLGRIGVLARMTYGTFLTATSTVLVAGTRTVAVAALGGTGAAAVGLGYVDGESGRGAHRRPKR